MSEPLTYIGDGRFVAGIPADDLDGDAIAELAERRGKTPAQLRKELADSGLYETPKKPDSKESKS